MSEIDRSLEKTMRRYQMYSFGDIAKAYTIEEESIIYRQVASLVSAKYGDIISRSEVENILKSKGNIYTMVVKNRLAFYEIESGNVGIPHFLRLTSTLNHELIHKIGFLQSDKTFKEMNPVFKEAGTEIVSATSLDDSFGRLFIFNGVYGKFPEKADDSFLSIAITNQINQALGGNSLEKSILKGHDYFKEEIIKKWGKDYYTFLTEKVNDLERVESKYWKEYKGLDDEEKAMYEDDMKHRIALIQDTILELGFGSRVSEIKSKEAAENFLNEVKEFGLNRVRHARYTSDGKREYFDPGFKETFEDYKYLLEADFGKLETTYTDASWLKSFPKKEILKEISEEESDEIYILARNLKKMSKANRGVSSIFKKIFGKDDEGFVENKKLSRPIDRYVVKVVPSEATIKQSSSAEEKPLRNDDLEK